MQEAIEKLIEGALDSHVHFAPDPFRERIADAVEIAVNAKRIGMAGVVLKSNDYPTTPLAQMTQKGIPGIEIIGSLTLNDSVGGINPNAVEISARMGGKVLWMPTSSSVWDRAKSGLSNGVSIMGSNGAVSAEVKEILALVKQFDLVLATGHISKKEIRMLFSEVVRMGIKKFVITHPLRVAGDYMDYRFQKEMAEAGAFIEHCFVSTMPKSGNVEPHKIIEAIKFVGVKKCLLSTDLGQIFNPPPWEGMRLMLSTFLRGGLSEEELSILVKANPRWLLNL